MFFGGGFSGRSTNRRRGPVRGADKRYDLTITFEEAAFGAKKEIEISRFEACDECGGTGAAKGTQPETCTQCNGTGEISYTQNTAFGRFVNVQTCNRCMGGYCYFGTL